MLQKIQTLQLSFDKFRYMVLPTIYKMMLKLMENLRNFNKLQFIVFS